MNRAIEYQSTCCKAPMPYMIARDAYVCLKCKNEYEVLSVECDHVMYTGGPPIQRPRYLLIGAGNEHSRRIHLTDTPRTDFSDGTLIKLDIDPGVKPDVVHDLDVLPYPFKDNEFDEIHAYECLEHCGRQGDGKFFFAQFAEFWRILKPNGVMAISVPVWDSEIAWGVPDHKRVLPPSIFGFLTPDYYKNVGKPGYADYRPWLGVTNFQVLGMQKVEEAMQMFIVLQAVKS